jgi:hypothetical protein
MGYAAALALVVPPHWLNGALQVLAATLLLLTAKWSYQLTRGATEAMRLLHLAPTTAPRQWLQGWAQHQALQALVLSGLGASLLGGHAGLWQAAWLLPATMLLAQGWAAWVALAVRRQASVVWLLATAATAGWGWQQRTALPPDWTPTQWAEACAAAAALGLWLLGAASARLLRIQRTGQRALSPAWDLLGGAQRGLQALRVRVSSPTLSGMPWWQGSRGLFLWSLVIGPGLDGGAWGGPMGPLYLPLHLLWTLLWVLILTINLRARPVHWRRALAPGSVLRQNLGWHILANGLRVQLAAAVCSLVTDMVWRLTQNEPVWPSLQAGPAWMMFLFSSTLATTLAGHTRHLPKRWLSRLAWVNFLGILAWLVVAGQKKPLVDEPILIHTGAAYVGVLFVATLALLPLCRRAWAQVDLYELMRSSARKATPGAAP